MGCRVNANKTPLLGGAAHIRLKENDEGKFTPRERNPYGTDYDREDMRSWIEKGRPYGVQTGTPSGVVVVDFDPRSFPEGATLRGEYKRLGLPPTYRVKSPGGGVHAYFTAPDDVLDATSKTNQFGPGVDFKGRNGYVVGPGVERYDGTYRVTRIMPPAPLPEALCEAVRERTATGSTGSPKAVAVDYADETSAHGAAVLADAVRKVQGAQPGERNDTLNAQTFRIGALINVGHVEPHEALDALRDAADAVGLTSEETEATLHSALGAAPAEVEGPDKPPPAVEDMFDALDDDDAAQLGAVSGNRWSDGRKWLIDGILPAGAYGLLSGPIGSGKSSVAGYVAARLSKQGARIRYLVSDESVAAAKHRVELAGGDTSLVDFREVPDLSTQARIASYAKDCLKDGVDLVIIDLLETSNPGYKGSEPEAAKRWVTALVDEFCTKRAVGVMGLWHWNNKGDARSSTGRLQGAGAVAGPSEFLWAVAKRRDNSEQVWTVERRRRCTGYNFLLRGTSHKVGQHNHPFTSMIEDEHVWTVDYDSDSARSAFDVERDDAREFAQGKKVQAKAADLIGPDMLRRYLAVQPRKMAEVLELTQIIAGVSWTRWTVLKLLKDSGAWQADRLGNPHPRGKFWSYDPMGPPEDELIEPHLPDDLLDADDDADISDADLAADLDAELDTEPFPETTTTTTNNNNKEPDREHQPQQQHRDQQPPRRGPRRGARQVHRQGDRGRGARSPA